MTPPAVGQCLIQRDGEGDWLLFSAPRAVYTTQQIDEVAALVARVAEQVEAQSLWAAGFISYEAAPAFDGSLTVRAATAPTAPLVWFGLYAAPAIVPADQLLRCNLPIRTSTGMPTGAQSRAQIALPATWRPSLTRTAFDERIQRIKRYIAAGDNYQTNFSMRLDAALGVSAGAVARDGERGAASAVDAAAPSAIGADPGCPDADALDAAAWQLFVSMVRANAPRCGAYIDTGSLVVASASPELLLRLNGEHIESRPMKGTAPRGRCTLEDVQQGEQLRASPKNRAENLMIVDMVRNDLARIATLGSVRAGRLFELERYPTLWTLTSTVRARTQASVFDVLAAMFPAASITGAPKRRTMAIIAELEATPRGVYTGSIGYIAPGRRAQFNVAIRTAVVDRAARTLQYGVGGGIVWDSTSSAEYDECVLKARVVTDPPVAFELLETLRWQSDVGFVLLTRHLERLLDSARYFDFSCDLDVARSELAACVAASAEDCVARRGADGALARRVRLLLSRTGDVTCSAQPLADAMLAASATRAAPVALTLATVPIDERDVFLLHKTTRRGMYERALAAAQIQDGGIGDVLLWNSAGEITETTIANVVVEIDGERVTPPVECGLLAGTLRAELLATGQIREARVTIADVRERATRLWLINSVRGWREAALR